MTVDLIIKSQAGDQESTLALIEKFNPLIKKYAYKLYYEDAYNDLLVDFIELIHNLNLEFIRYKNEGGIVTYISKSVKSSFIKKLTAIIKIRSIISYSDLNDNELYYIDALSSTYDKYLKNELPYIDKKLNKAESSILKRIYISGYSATELSAIYGVSRQAVNQMKKRALNKLKPLFLDESGKGVKV